MRKNNVAQPTAKQIRAWRKRAGLTQVEAAEVAYATRRTWQHWESGAHPMWRSTWELLLIKSGQLKP